MDTERHVTGNLNEKIYQKMGRYTVRRRHKKGWQRVVTAMAAIVVFCTTYALILPAITQERKPTCGMEEHEHEEACYREMEKILSCAVQVHIHGPECLDDQGLVICGNDQYLIHSHEDHCYDASGVLVCSLPERAVHQHRESCYALPEPSEEIQTAHEHGEDCYQSVPPILVCTQEEQPGHQHSEEDCYTYETNLICTLEETQGHQHGEACFDSEGNLICTQEELPGHTHGESCLEKTALLICTQEEIQGHQHEETCYEAQDPVLICEIPEGTPEPETEPVLLCGYLQPVFHQHGEDCFYVDRESPDALICELEAHVHDDLRCFTDLSADLEWEAQWVQTLPELSGRWMEDIVAVAESQLGYSESTRNYMVEENDAVKGYTRYGQWYGIPHGDWCAMFVSFCLHYAQVPGDVIPLECGCARWISKLEERGLYLTAAEAFTEEGEFLPVSGDLIFFDNNGNGLSDHVGLVASVEDGLLHTIEGNVGNSVRRLKYELTNPVILGYGLIPDQPEENTELILTEQTIQAVIYTDATLEQPAEDATVILISGMLPEGAVAVAYPVKLESNLIEGETILLAYDITILDAQGNPFEQTETEDPFRVSIQPTDWEPAEDAEYNVYYIPEDGDPQIVESESEEDIVVFNTDHFSTYALTTPGTLNTVYLNGASGNDSNAGNSTNSAVKTMNRALELVKDGGTIYITGTVTVSEDTQWDLEDSGVAIKRYVATRNSFTGPLITVANGGSLTLKNITINGGSGEPSSSNIATNVTYASNSAKAPLIVVQSGGSLNIRDGAVLEYNSNKPDSVSTSGYLGQGGAVYCQGNLNMTGGTIRYCEALSGGGIYIESANTSRITFNLSGGTITYNYAREIVSKTSDRDDPYHRNAGGGVYVGDYVTMNMSGGTISYNQSAREGGGISLGWLNRNDGSAISTYITTFNMTGGVFDHNTATSTGGGLNVTAGREAYIYAGYFTNNTANGNEYQTGDGSSSWTVYSGGGIYLDAKQTDSKGAYAGVPGYAKIHRVLITDNDAGYYGGGIATCATSSVTVNASVDMDGMLIYGNTASKGGNEMYLEGDTEVVGKKMLGGAEYSWTKSGAYYDNSLTESSAGVKAGKPLATVFITGNYAGVDGGGIGCNGEIEIGGEPNKESITITKIWNDDGTVPHPDSITVQVYQNNKPYGDPIVIRPTVGVDGSESWPTHYVDDLPTGYTYTVKEVDVPGFESSVTVDGSKVTITNTPTGFQVVKKWEGDTESDRPESITVQLYQDGVAYGDSVKLTASNGWKYTWFNLPEGYTYTAEELFIPEGYYSENSGELIKTDVWQITNIKIPMTSVSVEKRWEGGGPLDSVIVDLLSNGVKVGEATLNAANNWFHKWDDLPKLNNLGQEITYWVKEQAVSGFAESVKQATSADALRTWIDVDNMANQKEYLLVSSGRAMAVVDGKLTWTDASAILNGTQSADQSQLWRMNGTIQNNNDSKLFAINSGSIISPSYSFGIGSSGTNVTFSEGYLTATVTVWFNSQKKYFAMDANGNVSMLGEINGATQFTLYELSSNEGTWGESHFIVTNTKLPDSIRFKFGKYAVGASEEPTLLAGAVLELYKVTPDSDVTIPGTNEKGTLLETWTSENASGTNGGIHVKDLFSGTYYLIEKAAPSGHIGLSGPIVFEVAAEAGTVTLISCPYELTLSGGPEVEIPIYNTVTYVLPETGGTGTVLYTAGGLLLMLTSAVFLLITHGKRRRGSYDYL